MQFVIDGGLLNAICLVCLRTQCFCLWKCRHALFAAIAQYRSIFCLYNDIDIHFHTNIHLRLRPHFSKSNHSSKMSYEAIIIKTILPNLRVAYCNHCHVTFSDTCWYILMANSIPLEYATFMTSYYVFIVSLSECSYPFEAEY